MITVANDGLRRFGSYAEFGDTGGFLEAVHQYPVRLNVPPHHLPELHAMAHGLRRAILLNFEGPMNRVELESTWRRFCAEEGLHYHRIETPTDEKVVFSVDERLPPDLNPGMLTHMGKLFAYPVCCIQAHDRRPREFLSFPFVNGVHTLRPPGEPVSPAMNFFARESPFHLIKHLPCEYGCKRSLRLGRSLLRALDTSNPGLAAHIRSFTTGTVLYTGIGGLGIGFRGEMVDRELRYTGFWFQDNLSERMSRSAVACSGSLPRLLALLDLLKEGDRLRVNGLTVQVARGEQSLRELHCPPAERWFLIQYRDRTTRWFAMRKRK